MAFRQKEQVALTTCRRCGCPTVGFFTSTRTSKPYMVNVEAQPDRKGKLPRFGFAYRNAFHNCDDYRRWKADQDASEARRIAREQADAAQLPEVLDPATLLRENFVINVDNMCSWPIYQLYYKFGKSDSIYLSCDRVREDLQTVMEQYLSGEQKMWLKSRDKENPDLWHVTETGRCVLMNTPRRKADAVSNPISK